MKIQEFIDKSFVFAIAHGYDVIWRKFNARLKQNGCNINEALVLIAIYFEAQKQASPSALAAALRTSRGNVSHCLAKLVKQNYVRRTMSDGDARRLFISLTPEGARLAQRLIGEIESIEQHCESRLGQAGQGDMLRALFQLGDS